LKIIHFSDTHLGFSDLDIANDKGVNQREADFYEEFKDVIEAIILEIPRAIKNKINSQISPCITQFTSEKYTTITREKYQHIEVSRVVEL